jgi:hypothetical protein
VHIFICTRLRRTIHYINSIKPRACFPRRAPRRGISAAEGRAEAHDKALNRAGVWRESAGRPDWVCLEPARCFPARLPHAGRPRARFPRRAPAWHFPGGGSRGTHRNNQTRRRELELLEGAGSVEACAGALSLVGEHSGATSCDKGVDAAAVCNMIMSFIC